MKRVIPILAVAAVAGCAIVCYRYSHVPKASFEVGASDLSADFGRDGDGALMRAGSLLRPGVAYETATIR